MRRPTRINSGSVISHALLLTYTAIACLPVVLVLMNSFKSKRAIFGSPLSPPTFETFSLKGYQTAFARGEFTLYFLNSTVITLGSLFVVLLLGAMAAHALVESRWKGTRWVSLYFIVGIMIPIRLATVSLLHIVSGLGLTNSLLGLIIVYSAQSVPLATVILAEFMRQLPHELKDAARIDGASEYRIFFQIILPLTRSPMATVAVFSMIPIWNDLWFPLILAPGEATRTVTLGAQKFLGEYVTDWSAVLAALTLSVLPVLALYFIFSRQFVRSITAGASK